MRNQISFIAGDELLIQRRKERNQNLFQLNYVALVVGRVYSWVIFFCTKDMSIIQNREPIPVDSSRFKI